MNTPRWQHSVDETLREISPRRRWLIGVSGGRDSVALLHLLAERGYQKLVVCHLDHALRGRASRGDAQFVARLAKSLRLTCVSLRTEVKKLARQRGVSVETAARNARWDFFRKCARSQKARGIFLAHHADDQVETFLFHLLRGAGPAGLAAMRTVSHQDKLVVLRPMLGVWRGEIDLWLKERGIRWREDESNRNSEHTRNRIRQTILPHLAKTLGREVKPAIWRAAELLGAEEEWIASLLMNQSSALGAELDVAALRSEPVAKQRRLLRAWLERSRIPGGFAEIEAVRSLLNPDAKGRPAKVNLRADGHARRRAGRLWIERPGS